MSYPETTSIGIRFEERAGCYVLVDSQREGTQDVGAMWPDGKGRYMARFNLVAPTAEPLPVVTFEAGLNLLLNAYTAYDPQARERIRQHQSRPGSIFPSIVKVS